MLKGKFELFTLEIELDLREGTYKYVHISRQGPLFLEFDSKMKLGDQLEQS